MRRDTRFSVPIVENQHSRKFEYSKNRNFFAAGHHRVSDGNYRRDVVSAGLSAVTGKIHNFFPCPEISSNQMYV